ncbi:cytoplasmic polyadenylation element-binding protein 1-like [Paramacrobiotus metropolitanus]|uniref:cytoplasmic polyadenylation element-binding protein 1-like n=1 Tax=Paramacrobiotus metropolitanus TaxID=2943436 RepID=UPI0024459DFF|nr:cytoplasmic polyadenylation element-binding protein 1-like [Paramacrobiotus metropolitanus]
MALRQPKIIDLDLPSVPLVWTGSVMTPHILGSSFSNKVFVGGVPWDITETDLHCAFDCFGTVAVEWPAGFGPKSATEARHLKSPIRRPKYGYLYLIFEAEKSILNLLGSCTYEVEKHGF